MGKSALLTLVLVLLTASPILVWVKAPGEGKLRVAISGTKAFIAGGWWLLLGIFIYYNFLKGDLNPFGEKLLIAILLLLGISPLLFWIDHLNQGPSTPLIIGLKGVSSLVWILFLALVIYLSFVFSPLDLDRDRIVAQENSPDGAYEAVVVDRWGGATVSNNTLVVIRTKDGNRNTQRDQVLFHMEGIKKVHLTWTGPRQLTVRHEAGEVYEKLPTWRNVAVTYADP